MVHLNNFVGAAVGFALASVAGSSPAMQPVGEFAIDRTEVSIAQFRHFVQATGLRTLAEQAGGGSTYEGGWQQRAGWTWQAPFGRPGRDEEPAVHVTHSEAAAFCRWAGKRLPTDQEWGQAAYVESRTAPTDGFVPGRRYTYPTGEQPAGAQCLTECGTTQAAPGAVTTRGAGHALVGSTRAGVNGLFDMGGNVWEWVDSGPGVEQRTRGGSWWYGAQAMRDDHRQMKAADTAVVYIGFRCAKTLPARR